MANILKITGGVLWFILGLVITYLSYYTVDIFVGQMEITLMKIIFWIGLIVMWSLAMLITPVYLIIDGYKE